MRRGVRGGVPGCPFVPGCRICRTLGHGGQPAVQVFTLLGRREARPGAAENIQDGVTQTDHREPAEYKNLIDSLISFRAIC